MNVATETEGDVPFKHSFGECLLDVGLLGNHDRGLVGQIYLQRLVFSVGSSLHTPNSLSKSVSVFIYFYVKFWQSLGAWPDLDVLISALNLSSFCGICGLFSSPFEQGSSVMDNHFQRPDLYLLFDCVLDQKSVPQQADVVKVMYLMRIAVFTYSKTSAGELWSNIDSTFSWETELFLCCWLCLLLWSVSRLHLFLVHWPCNIYKYSFKLNPQTLKPAHKCVLVYGIPMYLMFNVYIHCRNDPICSCV